MISDCALTAVLSQLGPRTSDPSSNPGQWLHAGRRREDLHEAGHGQGVAGAGADDDAGRQHVADPLAIEHTATVSTTMRVQTFQARMACMLQSTTP